MRNSNSSAFHSICRRNFNSFSEWIYSPLSSPLTLPFSFYKIVSIIIGYSVWNGSLGIISLSPLMWYITPWTQRNICVLPNNIKLPGVRAGSGIPAWIPVHSIFCHSLFSCLISFLEDFVSHASWPNTSKLWIYSQ